LIWPEKPFATAADKSLHDPVRGHEFAPPSVEMAHRCRQAIAYNSFEVAYFFIAGTRMLPRDLRGVQIKANEPNILA
jgi:hypothetical protein